MRRADRLFEIIQLMRRRKLIRARELADETLRKVHVTLEPGQREQLAAMLEAGWRHRRYARG